MRTKRDIGHWLRVALIMSLANLSAETVTWTAMGTVDSAGGGYGDAGISPGDPVMMEFSYNSEAGFTPLKDVLGEVERDYWDGVELTVRVAIGSRFWTGSVATANEGLPRTLFTRDESMFPGEKVEATLTEEDEAAFSSFPLSLGGGEDSVVLSFNASGTEFLNEGSPRNKSWRIR